MKDIFIPREQWEEYDLTKSMDAVLTPRKRGAWIYYGFWPLLMAISFSKKAPELPPQKGLRLWPRVYVWDRLGKGEEEEGKGWTRVGSAPRKRLGVLEVRDGEYYKSWGDTTKNQRNRWLKMSESMYEVVEVPREEFFLEYKKSSTCKKVGKDIAKRIMKGMTGRDGAKELRVHYLLARKREGGEVRAGIAYELATLSTNTHYSVGFLKEREEKDPVMTGLLMEWIERARKKGYTYFNFGSFWKEGDPKSWKGYSSFKLKYGVKMYDLPQSLVKVRW
jgi:hypothetical protein